MSGIARLVKKTMECLKEEGVKNTIHMIQQYLSYQWSLHIAKRADYFDMKIKADELKALTEKNQNVVYIVAAIPYYDIGGGQRCSQLAKTLNKMGYRVKYLYSHPSCDEKDSKLFIPTETHVQIDEKVITYVKNHASKDDLFVIEAPFSKFGPIIDIAIEKGSKIVYENIDNWETSLGQQFFDEQVLRKVLSAADLLTGTAKPLITQLENYLEKYNIKDKKIVYLPNAVDDMLFFGLQKRERPKDLVQGTKTFLYYGSLWGEWFDWELVIGFAKRNPSYSINLIGNAAGIQNKVEECPDNIHFLGLKEQEKLPDYLQYVDYTLIPFKRGDIGDYVSPLKVFEYIAMYTRVLSTTLPDIQGYPNVYFGDIAEEWEKIVKDDFETDREAAEHFTAQNTWTARLITMLDNLNKTDRQGMFFGKLAIVVLNFNNKNIIFKCIDSLLAFKEAYQYEIIVVDNGSKDGSYELLCEKYKPEEVRIYQNTKNGCSSGRNLGVSKTNREYLLFLDSDQWATNDQWLNPYEEVIKKHPDFGAIGWGGGFFNYTGLTAHTVDYYPYRCMYPNMLCRNDLGFLATDGMLMRTELFHSIDGFDVEYDPTCYEDTDLSLKIRDFGKELYYCPHLGVNHWPHQTTHDGSEMHKKLMKEKGTYFVEKWRAKNPALLNYVKK